MFMSPQPPYSYRIDECAELICFNGELLLHNSSLHCRFNTTQPQCSLLGMPILINTDTCCPQWQCPCRSGCFTLNGSDEVNQMIKWCVLYFVATISFRQVDALWCQTCVWSRLMATTWPCMITALTFWLTCRERLLLALWRNVQPAR